MIQPTIRCARPGCECEVSMAKAMRVGTRLYCSFHCANGLTTSGFPAANDEALPRESTGVRELHAKAG